MEPNFTETQPRPNNHLALAIITTILCCLPAGIVSIVYATQVNSKYNAGDYEGAIKASKNAKTWWIVAAVVGIVVAIAYFAFAGTILAENPEFMKMMEEAQNQNY